MHRAVGESSALMEKKFFKNLVIAGFFRSLALSFTGLIDCAVVGHYLGTDNYTKVFFSV